MVFGNECPVPSSGISPEDNFNPSAQHSTTKILHTRTQALEGRYRIFAAQHQSVRTVPSDCIAHQIAADLAFDGGPLLNTKRLGEFFTKGNRLFCNLYCGEPVTQIDVMRSKHPESDDAI